MSLLAKLGQKNTILLITVKLSLPMTPLVITGSVDVHDPAQEAYRILHPELFDDFVVFPLPVTYSLFAPSPSTQYPILTALFLPPALPPAAADVLLHPMTCLCAMRMRHKAVFAFLQILLHPCRYKSVPDTPFSLYLYDGFMLFQMHLYVSELFFFAESPMRCPFLSHFLTSFYPFL